MVEGNKDNSSQLGEAELLERVQQITLEATAILSEGMRIAAQLRPLEIKRDALARQASELEKQRKAIDRRLDDIIEARKRQILVNTTRALVAAHREGLIRSEEPIVQDVSKVMGLVLDDSVFVNSLPEIVEQDGFSYTKRPDKDRINIQISKDSCRLVVCRDGAYTVIYHPRGIDEESRHNQMFSSLQFEPNYHVNTHFFGLWIDANEPNPKAKPMALFRAGKEGTTEYISFKLFQPDPELLAPTLGKISEILRTGYIILPKPLGKHKIAQTLQAS